MESEQPQVVLFGESKFIFESMPNEWIVPLLQQVFQLGSLPPNWDSYGGHPIDHAAVAATVMLLWNVLRPKDPPPAIVPTSRGGVLLEWHEGGIDLEIDIHSPSRFHLVVEEDGQEEVFVRADLEVIEEKLDMLRGRLK